uniref:CRAL-TRIO domain-containing protein n=1 Tax=Panagrolaimus superbus TaxID=310955 RepID=A0A914Z4D2_9BILA
MKARVYDLEVMLKAVMEKEAKTGQQTSILYIMDLDGLTFDTKLFTLVRGALASISNFMSEHYVELIHSFVLVNAPTFISAIWISEILFGFDSIYLWLYQFCAEIFLKIRKIAQPLLPERTRNKVKIFGANWKNEILDLAVPESLPAYWNQPGEPAIFHANVLRSVKLPINEYYKGGMLDERAKTLAVAASKTGFVERIGNEGQKLKWTFETDGHFAYGIYFSKDPGEFDTNKMECVYPRFNKVPGPTYVPLRDEIVLPKTGTYKFWFSNEHAYFHTLKIRHFINVE